MANAADCKLAPQGFDSLTVLQFDMFPSKAINLGPLSVREVWPQLINNANHDKMHINLFTWSFGVMVAHEVLILRVKVRNLQGLPILSPCRLIWYGTCFGSKNNECSNHSMETNLRLKDSGQASRSKLWYGPYIPGPVAQVPYRAVNHILRLSIQIDMLFRQRSSRE
jgi:hypothetical protein